MLFRSYHWCSDFACAHAIFATGLITAPVAVMHLAKRPYSGHAILFAAFCTTISLILCCSFYAELKRPPWPRWLAAPTEEERDRGHRQQQQQDGRESSSHEQLRRHPELTVMTRDDLRAALAANRIPSYEHREEEGAAAAECAVCLGEVEKGDSVRRMPLCQHLFHTECIDRWLRSHPTCPICRCSVIPPPERPPEVVLDVGS